MKNNSISAVNPLYINVKNLAIRYGVSVPSIWRWCEKGALPKPVKLSAGSTRWKLADIEKWEAEKEAE